MKRSHLRRYAITRPRTWKIKQFRHHPFVVPVVTFLVLFFITIVGFIALNGSQVGATDTKVVKLSYDHKIESLPTRAPTVGDLLKNVNITLHEGDVVEPAADTPIVEDNFRINVYRARPVTIVDGAHKTVALSAATTARSTAAQAGITVYPEDIIAATPVDNLLQDGVGEKILIDRATPVNFNLYGTPIVVRTHARTVGAMLKDKNVKLAQDDTIQPVPDTPLTANTQVFVTRNGVQIATVEQAITSPQQTVEDTSLSFGTTAVRQQGAQGKKLVTFQVTLQNGKEVSRQKIQEVTVTEPIPTIVARGKAVAIPGDKTAIMVGAGVSPGDYAYVNYIVSRESGWCATKWQGQVGYCPAYYQEIHSPSASVGYGLCQSTPPSKMSSAGSDWQTNPITQLKWCSGYASRYGGWGGAYNHWQTYHSW